MLIPAPELSRRYGVRAHGVLHVGAHEAEEAPAYQALSWGPVIWVEMLPDKAALIEQRFASDPNNIVLHAACWDVDGAELPVYRANNDQSSSLLPPDHHLAAHPEVTFAKGAAVRTTRLDTLLPKTAKFDFLNFDIQGAELRALRGLGALLDQVQWAYLEINERALYEDCALVGEVDAFMQERGFVRVATKMAVGYGWGDALYSRKVMPRWRQIVRRAFVVDR